MNRALWIIFFIVGCACETFSIVGEPTFTVGLRLNQGKNTRLEMSLAGDNLDKSSLELKDPSNGVLRKFTFNKEHAASMSFLPEKTGDYSLVLQNPSKGTIMFTVVLPEADEGPFASQIEANLGRDLEDALRRIISSHKALLIRQSEHLDKAKNTKSWIKKLTFFEVCLCMLALYYVHGEAVKTFYSTRKL